MTATAKPRKETVGTLQVSDVTGYVTELAQRRLALLEAADRVCAEIAESTPIEMLNYGKIDLGLDDRMLFEAIGWIPADDPKNLKFVARNVSRMASVLAWQKKAGTSGERQAAIEAAAKAAQDLEENEGRIEEQIAALQFQLHQLRDRAVGTKAVVEGQSAAVTQLRSLVPTHLLRFAEERKREVEAEYHDQIAVVEGPLNQEFDQLRREHDEARCAAEHAEEEANPKGLYNGRHLGDDQVQQLKSKAAQHRTRMADMKARLDRLAQSPKAEELKRLKAARDAAVEEFTRKYLDYYAR